MIVAIYVPFFPHGGSLKNLQHLLTVWSAKSDTRIVVVAPQAALDTIGDVIGHGAVRALPIPERRSFGFRRIAFERWGAAEFIKTVAPDVVFAPGGTIPTGLDMPTVANFQNVLPIQAKLWQGTRDLAIYLRQRVLRRHLRNALGKTDIAIFNSRSARDEFQRFYRRPLPRSAVLPRALAAIDVHDRDRDDLKKMGVAEGYLVTVGQIYAYRNLVPLIRGFGRYTKSNASVRQLVIVGHFGSRSEMKRVKAAIREQSLDQRVLLLGNQPHRTTLALLRHARVHLFSSSIENCPNALLEAMALGTPTICARASANPEFAQDAVFYVNPCSANDWSKALIEFVEDEQLHQVLGRRGKVITEQMAGIQEIAERTWAVLQSAIEQRLNVEK